jgi:translation initiation factor eIF-2B subunit beta
MLDILRLVVSSGKWGTVDNLIDLIQLIGKRCQEAQPIELCVGNTVRRLLNVIREECLSIFREEFSSAPPSQSNSPTLLPLSTSHLHLHHHQHHHHHHHHHHGSTGAHRSVFSLFDESDGIPMDYSTIKSTTTKSIFVEAINEMLDDMKTLYESIAAQSLAHIHSNEIILTLGDSITTETFFKLGSRKRTFHVIVVEGAPGFGGHKMAQKLAASGIETTLIPDSAIFAVMSRVNKVVLGTHAILANGGLIALSGANTVATAAKHYGIPVVVIAGLYKLTPLHPYDLDVLNSLAAPSSVSSYADDEISDQAEILNPLFDFVAPEFVSLFITNEGVYAPSYMYRLLTESYHMDDIDLNPRPGAFEKSGGATQGKGIRKHEGKRNSISSSSLVPSVQGAGDDSNW